MAPNQKSNESNGAGAQPATLVEASEGDLQQMYDPYQLQRFVEAQNPLYRQVLKELTAGHKSSHWMWFIFPQHRALGRSSMAQYFGIASREEAQAYWRHAVLGPRLRECTEAVLPIQGRSALQIFGSTDELKFRSSMTLFLLSVPEVPVFARALEKYFGGAPDDKTLALLR